MSFKVTVEPSGRSFDVPADQTILQAGIANNIPLPYGCQDGACGSCKCKKISGEVTMSTYQENALSAQELADGFILIDGMARHVAYPIDVPVGIVLALLGGPFFIWLFVRSSRR